MSGTKRPYITDPSANLTTIRDPMALLVGDTYYITGTQPPYWEGESDGVHLWSTKDFVHFENHGIVVKRSEMPDDMWCVDRFWAPELFAGTDGYFYLTFNCRNENPAYKHDHGVGIARAEKPEGPYEVLTKEKSLTEHMKQDDVLIGANDATMYADGDTMYLGCTANPAMYLFKFDPKECKLYDQKLVCEVGGENDWDHIGIEGQCIVKHHGIYFQWYSSWTNLYEAGILTSDSIEGPWKKWDKNPILGQNDVWHFCGHNHAFRAKDGKDYIIFHAFMNDEKDTDEYLPRLFVRRVEYYPDGTVKLFENESIV